MRYVSTDDTSTFDDWLEEMKRRGIKIDGEGDPNADSTTLADTVVHPALKRMMGAKQESQPQPLPQQPEQQPGYGAPEGLSQEGVQQHGAAVERMKQGRGGAGSALGQMLGKGLGMLLNAKLGGGEDGGGDIPAGGMPSDPNATRPRVVPGKPIGEQIDTTAGPATYYSRDNNPPVQQQPPAAPQSTYGDPMTDALMRDQPGQQPQQAPPQGAGQPPLSRSQQVLADYRKKEAEPAKTIPKWFKRILPALAEGVQVWNDNGQQGGLGGLIGTVGSVGTIGTVSKGTLGEMQKKRGLKKMLGDYQKEAAIDKVQSDRDQEILKTQTDDVEYRKKAAEPFIKAASAKGYMTDDEVRHIKEVYGVDITDPNNGEYVEREVNGKWMIRRKESPIYTENTTLDSELGEVYHDTKMPSGATVPLKAGQIATLEGSLANANAGRAERAGVREEGDVKGWEAEQQKARAQRAKATTSIASLKRSRQELVDQGLPTAEIDKTIATLDGDIAEANEILKRKRPKGGTKSKGKYSTADIERVMHQ